MSAERTERLLNLVFVLLNATRPIEREDIRTRVPGYANKSDDAFERMFERDKEELRQNAIPIETKPIDVFQEDVVGYIINRKDWLLPEIDLDSHERVLLSLAASAWQDAQVASIAHAALDRVTDIESDANIRTSLGRRQPNVAALLSAISEQRVIAFEYRNRDESAILRRRLEPWKMLLSAGAWYVAGFDLERQEQRIFKLSRFIGQATVTNESITHPVPRDLNLSEAVVNWRAQNSDGGVAVIRAAKGTCANLRLLASEVISSGDGMDELSISYTDRYQIVRELAMVCSDAQVVSPESLRTDVSAHIALTAKRHGISLKGGTHG